MITAKNKTSECSISAVIIRKDGTREDLGVIAYYHKNPIKRLIFEIKRRISKWLIR
jgi:hypothetical protein